MKIPTWLATMLGNIMGNKICLGVSYACVAVVICHLMPNLSCSRPNTDPQNCFSSGMITMPRADSLVNACFASSSVSNSRLRWNPRWPLELFTVHPILYRLLVYRCDCCSKQTSGGRMEPYEGITRGFWRDSSGLLRFCSVISACL